MSRNDKTKQTALCGVFSALAVVIMVVFSAIGIGTYAGPVLAMAVCIPILCEQGQRAAFLCYFCICVLSLMLVPDPELTLVYICFGWYPMAQKYIYRIKKLPIRIAVMIGIYTVIVTAGFRLLYALLGISELLKASRAVNITLAVLGALAFVLLDLALIRMRYIWISRLKKRIGLK